MWGDGSVISLRRGDLGGRSWLVGDPLRPLRMSRSVARWLLCHVSGWANEADGGMWMKIRRKMRARAVVGSDRDVSEQGLEFEVERDWPTCRPREF